MRAFQVVSVCWFAAAFSVGCFRSEGVVSTNTEDTTAENTPSDDSALSTDSVSARDSNGDSDTGDGFYDSATDTETGDTDTDDADTGDTDTCDAAVIPSMPTVNIDGLVVAEDASYISGYFSGVNSAAEVVFGSADRVRSLQLFPEHYQSFVAKYDESGRLSWALPIDVDANGFQPLEMTAAGDALYYSAWMPSGTTVLGDGQVEISNPSDTAGHLLVAKIDDSGSVAWARRFAFAIRAAPIQYPASDGGLVLILFPTAVTTIDMTDAEIAVSPTDLSAHAILVKLDAGGAIAFTRSVSADAVHAAHLDDGSIAVFGSTRTHAVVQNDARDVEIVSQNETDETGFAVRYDSMGNLLNVSETAVNGIDVQVYPSAEETLVVLSALPNTRVAGVVSPPALFDTAAQTFVAGTIDSTALTHAAFTVAGAISSCDVISARAFNEAVDVFIRCVAEAAGSELDRTVYFGSPSQNVEVVLRDGYGTVFAARYAADGALAAVKQLMSAPGSLDSVAVSASADMVHLSFDATADATYGDGAQAVTEPEFTLQGRRVVTFSEDLDYLSTVRYVGEGTVHIDAADNRYIHLKNGFDFKQLDNTFSVSSGALVGKRSPDGRTDWIVRGGAAASAVAYGETAFAVVSPTESYPVYVGPENSSEAIMDADETRTMHLVRMGNADGVVQSLSPAVTVFAPENEHPECADPMQEIFQCTDEQLTLKEASVYRGRLSAAEKLYQAAWGRAVEAVDPACIEACGSEEDCLVKAQCSSANGVSVEMSIQGDAEIGDSDLGGLDCSESQQNTLRLHAEDFGVSWRDVYLTADRSESRTDFSGHSSIETHADWSGRLLPNVPEDVNMDYAYSDGSDWEYWTGMRCSLQNDRCNISWSRSCYAQSATDFNYETLSLNGNTYSMEEPISRCPWISGCY